MKFHCKNNQRNLEQSNKYSADRQCIIVGFRTVSVCTTVLKMCLPVQFEESTSEFYNDSDYCNGHN